MTKKFGVGVGVMFLQDNKILLGKRHHNKQKAGSELHGEDTWTMPGGKVDFGEKLTQTAVREVKEETSLAINEKDLKLISLSDDIIPDDVHFVTAGFLCKKFKGESKVMEPDEIIDWQWFSISDLPSPMFFPSQKVVDNYLRKEIYKIKT